MEHERILYVITDPAPELPPIGAQNPIKDAYLKWVSDQTTVRCIMLAAMNDEFSRKFEEAQPDEILQKLKESFDTPDDVERYKMSCAIYNARMPNGGSVIDHVLYMIEMIEMIERLDKLGCPLHEQHGKDAILNSLLTRYWILVVLFIFVICCRDYRSVGDSRMERSFSVYVTQVASQEEDQLGV